MPMENLNNDSQMSKLPCYIPGFDLISEGGLPRGRTTLLSGSAGSAKTVFAVQFLAEGILRAGEAGVFVTFEETPQDVRNNMTGFGWNIADWEAKGKWAFVDISPQPDEPQMVTGDYDFGGLLSRIEYAIKKTGATRVSLDSVAAVFSPVCGCGYCTAGTVSGGGSP